MHLVYADSHRTNLVICMFPVEMMKGEIWKVSVDRLFAMLYCTSSISIVTWQHVRKADCQVHCRSAASDSRFQPALWCLLQFQTSYSRLGGHKTFFFCKGLDTEYLVKAVGHLSALLPLPL